MLTMTEAAEYVGISYYRFARHYRHDWRIPHHRVGGRVNFAQRDLDAYLARQRVEVYSCPRCGAETATDQRCEHNRAGNRAGVLTMTLPEDQQAGQ